ncbi:caspase family protein [Roseateles sp. DC23W]|uniref:caspase family protein n=1 Tax=Pelomonas dachongensis TaxID=3299029 RepID=UPI003749D56E
MHALVVGVSDYAHLPRHDDPPDPATWNLCSIGATSLSAARIATWLSGTALVHQLKTLRVLLSPTDVETAGVPAWAAGAGVPTRANLARALWDWHQDCQDDPQSVALFYYAGHGFSRGRGDVNLLLSCSDLFAPGGPRLSNTIAASNVFFGMAPQTAGDRIARQQFFFFDCCRSYPEEMKAFDDRTVAPALDVLLTEGVPDNRSYGRWFAAPDNQAAYASIGQGTRFEKAVSDAFLRAGRKKLVTGWQLDAESITARLNARYATLPGQMMVPDASSPGPVLRRMPAAPDVDLEVILDPTASAAGREVGFQHAAMGFVPGTLAAPGRHTIMLRPGEYDVKVRGPGMQWTAVLEGQIVLPDVENPWILRGWP